METKRGFANLYEIPPYRFNEPVLVSSTETVDEKFLLASLFKQYEPIGIDIVALCVNNILSYGASPLYFQDYYATESLTLSLAEQLMQGHSTGDVFWQKRVS